jgi:ABC-type branched-subunit amino acid transport system substrate-binding protein
MEANQGRSYSAGMELLFKQVNKAGGINGHQFTLVRKDDGGRPEDTVALTKELLADSKPLVLTGYFGNKNIDDLIASGVLQQEKVPLVGYRSWEIRAETPYVYSVRATLREQIAKLTEHLATIGITKLALFHEDGPGAQKLLAAADEAAKKAKVQIVGHASYQPGTAKATPAVDALMKAQPQAILLVSTGAAAAGFIEQYRASGGTAQIFTHADADVEQMAKRLADEQLQGVAISQVTPSPYKISSKVAKEMHDIIAKSDKLDVPVSYAMMEGFITAKVIVEAVRRQGRAPTREGIVAALDAMDNYDIGGFAVGYKPGMRTGSRWVELTIVSGAGKIRQ